MTDRLKTMARFDEEVPEEVVAGYCCECGEELFKGEAHSVFENEMFCDSDCFSNYMGLEVKIL